MCPSWTFRYRRSAGEERLQLKWFAYAAALSLGLMASLLPVSSDGGAGQVGLLAVAGEVLAPAHLSLWLREPGPFG